MLTVAGAGLLDGLNPCAFATIVFFISYLALLGRKGREILAMGRAFALGVLLTYLLVGLGMLKVLEELPFLTMLGRWVYGVTTLLCLILAVRISPARGATVRDNDTTGRDISSNGSVKSVAMLMKAT